jgi:hypothetical protein
LRQPKVVDGIPDYTARAISDQFDSLRILQSKLNQMDTSGWTRDEQVDFRLVTAHMHGLEFNHRIMHRWSGDPAYYSTIGWFNPTMEGAVYLPSLPIPENRLPGFKKRLEDKKVSLSGISGIGIDNYNWLLKNVYLSPYTWEQCITITQRELERSLAMLKFEEFKNRLLSPLPVIPRMHKPKLFGTIVRSHELMTRFMFREPGQRPLQPAWKKI